MTSKDLLQQLRELRQLYTESTAKFKAAYEKRFGFAEDSEPGPVSPISPLQLTIPETFHAKVQQYRLSSHAQEALSLSLNRLVDDFSQQFDEAWRNIALLMKREPKLRGQMSVVEDKLRAQFQHFFETNGMLKIVEAIKELEEIHSPQSAPKEPSFNKDYTPILETYFEYDAYPSARDQEIIAERSGMSKKQINIWFQNHRRVARQKGVSFKGRRPPGAEAPAASVPFLKHQDAEKQRMLDLFKKDANGANSAIDVFTSGGSASLSGSGTGVTPDDPIRIDSGELSLTTEVGMVITSAGNGVAILEPIDVVERIVREKERKARDDEMKEQKSKLLSVVTPRYQPELLRDTMHSSYLPSNPLETPVVPEGAPSSTFPAPYTRPAPETRFRLDPKHPWGPRPTLPRPNWSRIAPPSSYEIPVANAGNQSKDPRISKRSSKKLSKVDQTAQQKRDEAFASDWSLMEERLEKYMWGLDSEAPSSTPGQSIGETSSKSNSFSAVKEKTNTEYLCDLRGVCLDAATCAYTYVLPKAPFRAFVKGSLSGEAGGTDHSASTLNISVSSSQKQQRKQKKPAALGPKRKPRNAPSNSRAKSSESAPSVASSRELTPALQRQGSTSSLSSSNSDSSSPRPATPPSEPSVDATVIEAEIPLGFPEGFTAISTFEEYGVEMPNYYNFHEYTTGTSKASADVSRSAESAVASLIDAAPSLSPDHPSLSSTAKSSESIFSSQSFPAAASTQPTFPTSVTGFDYAFGNPYANSSSYPDNLSSSTKNMASGMHMINALIDDAGSTSNLGVSTAQVNHGFAAPPHSTSSATAWGVSNAGVNFYMASVNTGMNANYGMSFHALSGGGMW